jgi:hypothetical protein
MRYTLSVLALVAVVGVALLLPGQAQAPGCWYRQGGYGYYPPYPYVEHHHHHHWRKHHWHPGHRDPDFVHPY